MYKYAIFDLDDTLLDFYRGEIEGVTKILKEHKIDNLDLGLKKYLEINKRVWDEIENGAEIKPLLDTRFSKTMAFFDKQVDGKMVEQKYREMINHNYYKITGADKLLKKLNEAGINVIAGSNGIRNTQIERLKGSDLMTYFSKIIVSEDTGFAKPDIKFFEYIFSSNKDMNKENTIMIGDGINSDILGANQFEIDNIWFNPKHKKINSKIIPTFEVDNYQKIYEIITNK